MGDLTADLDFPQLFAGQPSLLHDAHRSTTRYGEKFIEGLITLFQTCAPLQGGRLGLICRKRPLKKRCGPPVFARLERLITRLF